MSDIVFDVDWIVAVKFKIEHVLQLPIEIATAIEYLIITSPSQIEPSRRKKYFAASWALIALKSSSSAISLQCVLTSKRSLTGFPFSSITDFPDRRG